MSKDFLSALPLPLSFFLLHSLCLCPSLSCIFNDLMFCELLKLCKQFELSATMRQQQQQLRQQLPLLLQRRQQKVAQSFLMLFGAPSLGSSRLLYLGTRSAWHRKCNFNEAFKWQLLYLPPATAPATVAVDDASDLGTHTHSHTHGREGVMQLLLL